MNEKTMILLCTQGDMKGFRALFERFRNPLLSTGMRMLGNSHDAEDAVQNTFMKVYKSIKDFKYKSSFSTYLFSIHMRVCLDMLRKKKRSRMQVLSPGMAAEKPDYSLRMQLEQAIGGLPVQQRACFVLFAVQGFKQAEIADMLGIATGSVKANIFHARMKLQKQLSENSGEKHGMP